MSSKIFYMLKAGTNLLPDFESTVLIVCRLKFMLSTYFNLRFPYFFLVQFFLLKALSFIKRLFQRLGIDVNNF